MNHSPLTIVIAGSTEHTCWCAQALADSPGVRITRVITPEPKVLGRKKILTPNPLHQWAVSVDIPVTLVTQRVDQSIKVALAGLERPDILLVVDFGYFIPRWLLEWPQCGPLNIHPSMLPRWRGSSPGQFPLLYGDTTSGITLMVMNEEFDAGPIVHQIPFAVKDDWTADVYYRHAFNLITPQLPSLLTKFAADQLKPANQPEESPTAVAQKLTRDDGRIAWELLERLQAGAQDAQHCEFGAVSAILMDAFAVSGNIYQVVTRAVRAFSPWPGLWTMIPTRQGTKRLKLLTVHLENTPQRLVLDQVQLEGKQPATWQQIKNNVIHENR